MGINLGIRPHLADKVFYDPEDEVIIKKYSWSLCGKKNRKYLVGWIDKKRYLLHRYLMGVTDVKVQVDHIDSNPLNNCRSNLRLCTNQQNSCSQRVGSRQVNNIYKGVTKIKGKNLTNPYMAQITYNYKYYYLGLFPDPISAARAYNSKAKELHGDFAILNPV